MLLQCIKIFNFIFRIKPKGFSYIFVARNSTEFKVVKNLEYVQVLDFKSNNNAICIIEFFFQITISNVFIIL